MGRADFYEEGSWNAVCAECGRKRKNTQMSQNWQGFWVCEEHNIPRQPQDFVRGVPDNPSAPWVQPMPTNVFSTQCTPNGISAIPGYAEAGCAFPAYLSPAFNPLGDPY